MTSKQLRRSSLRDDITILKVKVKVTLVQTLRLCTGRTAHRGSRSIALPFHDHDTRSGLGVSVTPRPLFIPRKDPALIVQEAGWTPGPVWTVAKNLAPPTGFDLRTAQTVVHSLYRLSHPAHILQYDLRLTHWGRVTQICVFTLQLCKTDDANLCF